MNERQQPAVGAARVCPVSFNQRRLWFVDQVVPGGCAYVMYVAARVAGGVDAGVLGQALAVVAGRHAALRTVFAVAGGEPVQVVGPPGPVELEVVPARAGGPVAAGALAGWL